jgi:K+ transporter
MFMTAFQSLPFIMIILLIVFITSSIFLKKKNLPVELFFEGLKYKNDGHFEEAIVNYKNALDVVKKNRFHNSLENKIIQKIKILHTIIEYKKSFQFIR